MEKIFEVPPQKERPFEDQLLEALINGARQSIHAKNADGSDGGLESFMTTVANRDPIRYMHALLNKLAIEQET
jgi:hypothetical protein